MKEPKLIAILKTFSKEELKRFGKFINSPYFCGERDFLPLYNIFKKLHPDFPVDKITEKELFKKLYPGKKYISKKSSLTIRVLFSQMTALSKKFIVYERFEHGERNYEFNENVSDYFAGRRLFKLAIQAQQMASSALDEGEKAEDFYHRRIKMDEWLSTLYIYQGTYRDIFQHQRNNLLYLYAYMFNTLSRYLNNASVNTINRGVSIRGFELARSFVSAFDPGLFDREFESDTFETKNITMYLYYALKSRLDENDLDSLLKALEYYYKFFPNVSRHYQLNFFVKLFNLFRECPKRDRIYTVKLNELIDFAWGAGLYCYDYTYYLDPYGYLNVLDIKLYLLSSSEVLKFINTYVEKIDPLYRDDIRDFSTALLYFKERLFGKCLEHISKRDGTGLMLRIRKYKLKICSLFEEGLYEEAMYAANSLEHYLIRNKKEVGPAISKHTQFLKAFSALMKLKDNKSNGNKANDNYLFGINKYSMFGEWFTEKLDINEVSKKLRGTSRSVSAAFPK
ncbi:MAG TPA: hypothetical protein VJ455_06895 [Ignavibacteria bacterium]|nr:hypothetical protein [Ignavibacteria bacterium]